MASTRHFKSLLRFFIALFFLPFCLSAQVLPDQIWLHGINDFPGQPGYGNSYLRFENGLVFIQQEDLRMNFESTMAVMPDTFGNILFYTNGCHIANAQGDTMPNGAGINPGEMHDWTCPTSGYASPLGAMILQMPDKPNLYYLFHMGVQYGTERKLNYGPFYFTIIDMELDGGKGAVISKNNIVADGNFEPFASVRHGNGRDWWLIFPEYGTNKYRKFLFSDTGLEEKEVQSIGQSLSCRYIGSSAFSPNGIRYARQQHCGVVALDFDRCSGQFSNDRFLSLPANAFGGGGVAFNKNGDRLMVSTQLSVLAADLTQPNPQLDTIVGSLDIIGSSLHLMQYGADGKIYLSNLGRGKFYHVINQPNEPEIDFQQRWYDLANYSVRTLPNYPNYRLYDMPESICDTLGINAPPIVGTTSLANPNVLLWPNPVGETLYLQTGAEMETLEIFDATGKKARLVVPTFSEEEISVNVCHLPPGLYYLILRFKDKVWSGKFVKQ
jgi:hypothetical protein